MESTITQVRDGQANGGRPESGKSYNAPAVDKALDVLELLGDSSQGLSLTGIADALGRTRPELFRVLNCLHARGYLLRDDAQLYRLSTRLFEIGSQHATTETLIARATPHMERLTAEVGESCHLNIVVQNRMLVVSRVECDADVMLTVRVGATFDLHRRPSGLVGLAHLSELQQREYWKQSGESAAFIEETAEKLARISDQGWLHEDSSMVVGVKDCAAPICSANRKLVGVLCVSHVQRKDDDIQRPDLVRAVVSCAAAVSAEFGPPAKSA